MNILKLHNTRKDILQKIICVLLFHMQAKNLEF